MKRFLSLDDFATEDMIVRVLTKERAKVDVNQKKDARLSPLAEQLFLMMPPKPIWTRPGKDIRPKKSGRCTDRWTYPRKISDARIYLTIKKARSINPEVQWLKNLDTYVLRIKELIRNPESFCFQTPDIYKVFKNRDKIGNFIYRPICVYSDLDTKVIMSILYKYLLGVLDGCFHRNMLFMRATREGKTFNYTECIGRAKKYRENHEKENIYVGECDIQTFYDILNHDKAIGCFNELLAMRASQQGVDISSYSKPLALLEKYLSSYDFYHQVWMKNSDKSEWAREERKIIRQQAKGGVGIEKPVCKFKWLSDDDFIASRCYDKESLQRAKEEGRLGIPQGGSLSGLIVNVVMQCVDDDIVREKDEGRFFVRYCDDILLMHTDKEKCEQYLETYFRNLNKYCLVPHPAKNVADSKHGCRTLQSFWKDSKSKNVYLWGKGEGNASEWIGFVGYEMSRSGEIRIRKDKIDEFHKKIAHKYYQVIHSRGGGPAKNLEKFDKLPPKILDYEMATTGSGSSVNQAQHLDKYLKYRYKKAAKMLRVENPGNPVTFEETVKQNAKEQNNKIGKYGKTTWNIRTY